MLSTNAFNYINVLDKAADASWKRESDYKIDHANLDHLNPSVYTDLTNYSYRLDGSNVDIDSEEVEYASEQIRYQGITAGINNQFSRMKSVIS